MPRVLLEDFCGEFKIDRAKIISEKAELGKVGSYVMPGRLSVANVGNGNGRSYPLKVWEKNLSEGSPLQTSIKEVSCFGLLEHPEDGRIDLRSPIAVRLLSARLEGNEVVGEIKILDTPEGQRLKILIDEGYNPRVSSRGFGSVVRTSAGLDEVQDDFICEGWDIVFKPSFANAVLQPARESVAPVAESVKNLKESTPSTGPASADTSVKTTNTPQNNMDLKSIRERLETFRREDVSKLTPQRFAEGMSQLDELHREVANFVAENTKSSWEGNKLHSEISSVESAWTASLHAPQQIVSKLREDNVKMLKVTSAVAKAGLSYKSKLADAQKASLEGTKLVEEVTKRGRAWKARAESLESDLSKTEEALQLATDGLDSLVERYNNDLTEAGKRLLVLEFKEKTQQEDIAKLLKDAKKPDDIIAIREKLDPTAKKEEPEAPKADASTEAPKADAPKVESKDAPAPEEKKNEEISPAPAGEAPAPVKEGKKDAPEGKPAHITSMTESLGIALRLSKSNQLTDALATSTNS